MNCLRRNAGATLAGKLIDQVERTVRQLARLPKVGQLWNDAIAPGVRYWPVEGFRTHLLFYREHETNLEILGLFHAAQDIERHLGPDIEPLTPPEQSEQ